MQHAAGGSRKSDDAEIDMENEQQASPDCRNEVNQAHEPKKLSGEAIRQPERHSADQQHDARNIKRYLEFTSSWLILGLGQAETAETVPDVIKAKTFIAVDDEGNERVLLGSTARGYGLDLFDYAGRIRMQLVVNAHSFQPTFSGGTVTFKDGVRTFERTTGTQTQAKLRIAQHASLLLYDAEGEVIYLLEE